MITDPSEIPENAVVSANKPSNNLNVFHTHPECPYYPEETRPATWEDVRANTRQCTRCQSWGVPELDE